MVKATGILLSLLLTVTSGVWRSRLRTRRRHQKQRNRQPSIWRRRSRFVADEDACLGGKLRVRIRHSAMRLPERGSRHAQRKDLEEGCRIDVGCRPQFAQGRRRLAGIDRPRANFLCNEKKTGTQPGAMLLATRSVLHISREQKEMAELQDKALRSGSPADLQELKQRSAKLVVIGVGVKRMASGSSCTN